MQRIDRLRRRFAVFGLDQKVDLVFTQILDLITL
jgi:hypothetical protein